MVSPSTLPETTGSAIYHAEHVPHGAIDCGVMIDHHDGAGTFLGSEVQRTVEADQDITFCRDALGQDNSGQERNDECQEEDQGSATHPVGSFHAIQQSVPDNR
jgi:hypothetical protein